MKIITLHLTLVMVLKWYSSFIYLLCWEIQLLFLIPSMKLVAPCSQNIGLHQGKETAVPQEPCYTYTHYSYLWLAGYMHSAVFPQYHFATFIKVPSRRPYRTKAIQYMFACFGQHRVFALTLYCRHSASNFSIRHIFVLNQTK